MYRFVSDKGFSGPGLLPYLHDPIADLFDDWYNSEWDEQKYKQYLLMKRIPGVADNIAIYEGSHANNEYLERYKMGWSDVKNPIKMPGTNMMLSGYGGALNFVSHNLSRLYK